MFQASPDAYGPKKALVADDNGLMNALMAHMLMHRGFAVTEVPSGEAALEALLSDVFDLVVLDIRMYSLSGIEVCHLIRKDLGLIHLPVIAYTVHHERDDISHIQLAGFNDILFKPLSDAALDQVLNRVFAAA